MLKVKRCAVGIGLALICGAVAFATPPLTTVQDVLFNADGTRFNGIATITWQSFVASDQSNIPGNSLTTQIVNGLLIVQLVPTTNALSPASYSVVYNSGGSTQFTENWAVPSSNVPMPVSSIRISAAGTVVSGGGSGGGGGAGSVTTPVAITDVTGLSAALNIRPTMGSGYTASRAAVIDASGALDGAAGNLTDCLHVDGTSGPCGSSGSTGSSSSVVFVDGETPAGVANGSNSAFSLANTPNPATSLTLFRNGLLTRAGVDYTLSTNQITFLGTSIPQTGDTLQASYRLSTLAGVGFVDSETPGGTVNGSNTSFTLSQAPNPAASLSLYRNGMRMSANLDYTLAGTGIVFVPTQTPQPGDLLQASYRIAQ
jgi:hypothetical protein